MIFLSFLLIHRLSYFSHYKIIRLAYLLNYPLDCLAGKFACKIKKKYINFIIKYKILILKIYLLYKKNFLTFILLILLENFFKIIKKIYKIIYNLILKLSFNNFIIKFFCIFLKNFICLQTNLITLLLIKVIIFIIKL